MAMFVFVVFFVFFANSGDSDQTPHSAASDLSLHYLPLTLLGSPD